jgi:hypothetical protein
MNKLEKIIKNINNDGFEYIINCNKKKIFTKKGNIIIINESILMYFSYEDIILLYNNINKKPENKKTQNSKFASNIRNLIGHSIRKKGFIKKSKTNDILGCSFEELKQHLESKFEPWMDWNNRGLYNGELNYGWDIDHIIPVSSAKTEEEILKLNHYINLQPLCSYTNRCIKRDKLL